MIVARFIFSRPNVGHPRLLSDGYYAFVGTLASAPKPQSQASV
jgi:hypothetical protein